MPTALGGKFRPDFQGPPPHMSVEDYEIWKRWHPTLGQGIIALYFDVGLGLPDQLPITDDAAQLAGWIRNTQKRADVIIEWPDMIWLVELRFNAQSSAIGRLLTYQHLLIQDNPFSKPVNTYLVTNKFDSEVAAVAAQALIQYVVA